MSFGMYLTAFFCSPVYFLFRGRLGAAFLNGLCYLTAVSLLLLGVGVFFWAFCVAHAMWDLRGALREREMQRQAALIAQSMSMPFAAIHDPRGR